MVHISQQQLLMLLLVIDTQLNLPTKLRMTFFLVEGDNAFIDIFPPIEDFCKGWSGDEPTLRARVLVADSVVVTIEENCVFIIPRSKTFLKGLQDHHFVKPSRVRQMPLSRTRILHRLRLAILRSEALNQIDRLLPTAFEFSSSVKFTPL